MIKKNTRGAEEKMENTANRKLTGLIQDEPKAMI